jgi:hypothetical protein
MHERVSADFFFELARGSINPQVMTVSDSGNMEFREKEAGRKNEQTKKKKKWTL